MASENTTNEKSILFQISSVDGELFEKKCSKCPANEGVIDHLGIRRKVLHCMLHDCLLAGMTSEAAQISREIEKVLEGDPGCPPNKGAKKIREEEMVSGGLEAELKSSHRANLSA